MGNRSYLHRPTPASRRIVKALAVKGYTVTAMRHAPYGLEPGSSYTEDFTYMRGGWEIEFTPATDFIRILPVATAIGDGRFSPERIDSPIAGSAHKGNKAALSPAEEE